MNSKIFKTVKEAEKFRSYISADNDVVICPLSYWDQITYEAEWVVHYAKKLPN